MSLFDRLSKSPIRLVQQLAVILLSLLFTMLLLSLSFQKSAVQAQNPLHRADASSPKATLKSFIENMKQLYRNFKNHGFSETGRAEAVVYKDRVVRCLDLSEVPPTVRDNIGVETAIMLMEVFDRIGVPFEGLPDKEELKKSKAVRWSIGDTDIWIALVKEGPRSGAFLFSPETVGRARFYYNQVKHLEYKPNTIVKNAAHIYLLSPGSMIPVQWIVNLPPWLRIIVLGQPIWKWLAAAVLLLWLVASLVETFRFGSRKSENEPRAPFWKRVLFPITGMVLAYFAGYMVAYQIRLVQTTLYIARAALDVLFYLSAAWFVVLVNNGFSNLITSSARLSTKGIDAHLVRVVFRVLSLIALALLLLAMTTSLGIPVTPVLAGLGVGGVAIALAAKNSLENLLGGVNLFVDRPIRVGDFCRFGSKLGTIEEIGLRSTRVRTLERTVVSVPNATFSQQELENLSRRDKIRYQPLIRLRLETSPDQVRYVLVEVRKLLYSHPKVDPEPARVRFVEFGEYSLDVKIHAYVNVTNYSEFLEVAEDLNLRIMDIIADAGTELAMPARRTHVQNDAGLNEARSKKAEEQVRDWKDTNSLYLPGFPAEKIAELHASVDYPPQGSALRSCTDSQDGSAKK